jgi:hypothetical protein
MLKQEAQSGHRDSTAPSRSPDAARTGIGKSPLVQSVSAAGPQAEAASTAGHKQDLESALGDAVSAWTHTVAERRDAINALYSVLTNQPAHNVQPSLLAQIAGFAIGVATDEVLAKVTSIVAKDVIGLIRAHLGGSHQAADPVNQKTILAFQQMQLESLNTDADNATRGIDGIGADLRAQIHSHQITEQTAIGRVNSITSALDSVRKQTYQIQYNTSLAKWFSALSRASFGQDKKTGASELAAHAPTNPFEFGDGDSNYGQGYKGKVGFVHLQLVLEKGELVVNQFSTPGIPEDAWNYARDDKRSALGATKLGQLPQHQHLPVVADLLFYPPHNSNLELAFPHRVPDPPQAIAITWDENNQVQIKLPAIDDAKDKNLNQRAQGWLGQQLGKAVGQPDAEHAANAIMHDRVGVQTLQSLSKKPRL